MKNFGQLCAALLFALPASLGALVVASAEEPTAAPLPGGSEVASSITIDVSRRETAELPPDVVPDVDPVTGTRREKPLTSRGVARAPLPDQAHGMSRQDPTSGENRMRALGRVLLFVPRVAVEVVDAPIRGALWTYDRYELKARARDIFFNDAGTIGLYPVADIETGYGLTGGARFVHRDMFGEREKLSMRASFGGRYNQQYTANVSSGDRFGQRLRLETEGEYEINPRDRFFGIGNGDEVEMTAAPIDPYEDPSAIDSRFRQRVARVYGMARVRLFGPVSARWTSGVLSKRFEAPSRGDIPSGTDITDHYETDALPAFEEGTDYTYHELELRYDSRRQSTVWEPESVPSTGWLIAGYGGVARGFDGAPTRYTRYGGDVQRYFRLGDSPRVLVLRAMAEEVRGDEDEIPFVDLPRLGGPYLLRGYSRDRFRDNAMALTSAEYQFDLGRGFLGYLFVDGGRVYPRLVDVTAEDIRIGYGGGIQLHTQRSFLARFNLASSVDGGIFFNMNFDPVYDPTARVERD